MNTPETPSATPADTQSIPQEDRILVLRNLITSDDVEDEETLSETLNDMQTLSRPFHHGLKSIWVEHAGRVMMNHRLPFRDLADESVLFEEETNFAFPLTLIELIDSSLACNIVQGLQSVVVGGYSLQVGLSTHKLEYAKHWQCPIISQSELLHGKEGYRCAIMICDFVSYDQVENEEERQEIVEDIKSILSNVVKTSGGNSGIDGMEEFAIDKIVFILSRDTALASTSPVHVLLTMTCKNVVPIVDHVEPLPTSSTVVESAPSSVDTNPSESTSKRPKKQKNKKEISQPTRKPVASCKEHAIIAERLHQTIVGGCCLRTSVLYINEDFVSIDQIGDSSKDDEVSDVSLMSFEDFNAVSLIISTAEGHCVVAVSQYVTVDDIADEVVTLNDPETVMVCKRDFLQLLNDKHLLNHAESYEKLIKITVSIPASTMNAPPIMSAKTVSETTEYLLCMKFNATVDNHGTGRSLTDALTYFDGLVVSGVPLEAEIESACNHDVNKSIISVDLTNTSLNKFNMGQSMMQFLLLPLECYQCAFQEDYPLPDMDSMGPVTVIDESSITLPRSRYTAAKQAPRLQIHRNPEKSIPVS
jgi:hypothetical protein